MSAPIVRYTDGSPPATVWAYQQLCRPSGGGSSVWVGSATSDLVMNTYQIQGNPTNGDQISFPNNMGLGGVVINSGSLAGSLIGSAYSGLQLTDGSTSGSNVQLNSAGVVLTPTTSNVNASIDLLSKKIYVLAPDASYAQLPCIQYGEASVIGSLGTITVALPASYTSAASYVVQVTMEDGSPAEIAATRLNGMSFGITWNIPAATGPTHNIMWTTFGL